MTFWVDRLSGSTREMQQHLALTLKDFVSLLDDEPVGHDQITQALDVKRVFHLRSGRHVLA
jgi:hypothetical protein